MHWDEMIEESREEGEKAGLEKGRAEGEKAGLEKGRAEGISIGDMNRGYCDVDCLIADGRYDEAEACKLLKVDYEAYKAYKSAAAGAEKR